MALGRTSGEGNTERMKSYANALETDLGRQVNVRELNLTLDLTIKFNLILDFASSRVKI